MMKESITQAHGNVTVMANKSFAPTPVAILEVPGEMRFAIRDNTPLAIKLYTTGGAEIAASSKIYLDWKAVTGTDTNQIGQEMTYDVFRELTFAEQQNINTEASRLMFISGSEKERDTRGERSIISGLPTAYKIRLVVESPDIVDWVSRPSKFNFAAFSMSEIKFERKVTPIEHIVDAIEDDLLPIEERII